MSIGIEVLIPVLFFGAGLALLYDAVMWSDAQWDAAGLRKLPWFLALTVLGLVGGALYWFRARPRLEKVNLRY